MANPQHLELLLEAISKGDMEIWNAARNTRQDIRPDLSGAKLKELNLMNADLTQADLRNAQLTDSNLRDVKLIAANFGGADLRHANLSHANLRLAMFMNSNLSHARLFGANVISGDFTSATLDAADLRGSDLRQTKLNSARLLNTDFSGAKLDNADFEGALLGGTILADTDLNTVKGLNGVRHLGPSIIGVDTFFRSIDQISDEFLKHSGVPEDFLIYRRSLVGSPIEFYSCFISHSSGDQQFCDRLYADLQFRKVRVWYFPEDATWGKSVWGEIDQSIKVFDKLVIVCSKHSLESGPVLREIERALNREDREGKNVLFPIRIDDYVFSGWEHPRKADVLQKVVGDFTDWDSDSAKYEQSLKRLIKALKSEPSAAT